MEVGVGTPPQKQSMVLSLGHSDSFVRYHELCEAESTETPMNRTGGFFDEEHYATFDFIKDLDDTYYGSWGRKRIGGAMIFETLTMDDAKKKNISMTVALSTDIPAGRFGLASPWSYPRGAVLEHRSVLIDEMILFGNVDKSKFDGKPQRFQASLARDKLAANASKVGDKERFIPGYIANVSTVWASSGHKEPSVWANTSTGAGSFYAAIDPTVTILILPEQVVDCLFEAVSIRALHNVGLRFLSCNETAIFDTTFTLELGGEGGNRLDVTAKDLLVAAEQWHNLRTDYDDPTV